MKDIECCCKLCRHNDDGFCNNTKLKVNKSFFDGYTLEYDVVPCDYINRPDLRDAYDIGWSDGYNEA